MTNTFLHISALQMFPMQKYCTISVLQTEFPFFFTDHALGRAEALLRVHFGPLLCYHLQQLAAGQQVYNTREEGKEEWTLGAWLYYRMQCQMSLPKKVTCKWTLRQVFYLSETPSPPMTPYSPPPLYTVYVYTAYLFTQGRAEQGRANQREG